MLVIKYMPWEVENFQFWFISSTLQFSAGLLKTKCLQMQLADIFDHHVLVEGGTTECRRLERLVSLVQSPTGPVAAVKWVRTTGSHSPNKIGDISTNITRRGWCDFKLSKKLIRHHRVQPSILCYRTNYQDLRKRLYLEESKVRDKFLLKIGNVWSMSK